MRTEDLPKDFRPYFDRLFDSGEALEETLFLFFMFQGQDVLQEMLIFVKDYLSDENIRKYQEEKYPPDFYLQSHLIDKEVKRQLSEYNYVYNLLLSLSSDDLHEVKNNPTQDFMLELGFPLRYAKLAFSWRAKVEQDKEKIPFGSAIRDNIISFIKEKGNKDAIIEELSLQSNLDKKDINSFLDGEEIEHDKIRRLGEAITKLR